VRSSIARDLRKWRFWRHLTTYFFAGVGAFATLLELYDVFFPGNIGHHATVIAVTVLLLSLTYALSRAWPRPIEQRYTNLNSEVRIVPGDLFDQQANLVVGFTDTFDTSLPHIIERTSVQGQFTDRIYGGDVARLDAEITTALANVTSIGIITKDGKTVQYPLGTVAILSGNPYSYYCLAYTNMDTNNNAYGTADGVWRSLDALWRAISIHGNGQPIAMPVIGGGMSRMAHILPAQDAIRFIALSFILANRSGRVSERLDIVIRPQDERHLDMLELQAFLKSLRKS
jgi:hypothetical protein